ncbi:carboxylate-amine ligase [Andreprevotia lacus DSM 23236]|jgi:carboxylate-amine ligase|uniref:Putative glutamate--cysteine ligase 2 n=1 Tax=Andreprevotia lacus DSM 23236 TaxID=1121001 RepID=A0A1W1XQR7_9NEIS|nr:YbdK family carboxylate-amine ligase [Andreprevotia lacus]SMC26202.1 carboxylate-amine ligase [Andreprevotia lacus DSM 23236]
MSLPPFKSGSLLTMGIELELMLLDPQDYTMAPAALTLLDLMRVRQDTRFVFCPEITQGMVEFNSAVHPRWHSLRDELTGMRGFLGALAAECGILIAGGGTHALQDWKDREVFPAERYEWLGEKFGYLSKKFTIFGMHVHIGAGDAETAIALIRAVTPWVPLLIALSAASPYQEGVDTGFACSRLHSLTPFPYAGAMPDFADWGECERYINGLIELGIVGSIKDFYWDVRPKPEFGTIEFRIFDTPLSVDLAADMAGLVQVLCAAMLDSQPLTALHDSYPYNRFQACRYGLAGEMVNPYTGERQSFVDAAEALLKQLEPYARELDATAVLQRMRQRLHDDMLSDVMRNIVAEADGDLKRLLAWQAQCFGAGEILLPGTTKVAAASPV